MTHPLDRTALVADPSLIDGVALMGERVWSWREVHAASVALAARLRPTATVCNLCGSRIGFLIAWLALLRRGCIQLLPPSGGHGDLAAILRSSTDPVIVVDDERLLQPHWREHAECVVQPASALSAQVSGSELAWRPDWDAPLVRLYTSGSTGTPEAQHRTLGQLARGAQVLAARLEQEVDGGLAALKRIVCSVPPQHMFGLETSVMLSLVAGIPVQEGRPLLPADVRAALALGSGAAAWIATPLHLRAVAQAEESLVRCSLVVASTMPLAPALAAQAEALAGAPVMEIYGSTETGAIAMRRTARESAWRPLDDVRMQPLPEGTRVWGGHFESPRLLSDEIEPDAAGGFRLVGRHGDVLKIAGRRASLSGLNLLLQDLAGLDDGVFYLPASGSPTERLVLIYAGAALDRGATLRWLRARIDPVFLPRTLIRVEQLPRTAASKLPRAALDEIYAAHRSAGKAR